MTEEPQQEPVHSPHRDDAPPKRTLTPLVGITVAIALVLVLAVALFVAAGLTA